MPSNIYDIALWYTSGAEQMPKGTWLKQNHPKGIQSYNNYNNSNNNSWSSGIYQNLLFASIFKTFTQSQISENPKLTKNVQQFTHKSNFKSYKLRIIIVPKILGQRVNLFSCYLSNFQCLLLQSQANCELLMKRNKSIWLTKLTLKNVRKKLLHV